MAVAKIKSSLPDARLETISMVDLTDIKQATAAGASFTRPLHILCNNAGVMATPWGLTKDGFEMQFGTNHLVSDARLQWDAPCARRTATLRVSGCKS